MFGFLSRTSVKKKRALQKNFWFFYRKKIVNPNFNAFWLITFKIAFRITNHWASNVFFSLLSSPMFKIREPRHYIQNSIHYRKSNIFNCTECKMWQKVQGSSSSKNGNWKFSHFYCFIIEQYNKYIYFFILTFSLFSRKFSLNNFLLKLMNIVEHCIHFNKNLFIIICRNIANHFLHIFSN